MQYTSADVWRGPIRESPDKIWFQVYSDVEFVQNFTPPDFQAKKFTPSISPNFNSFSKKQAQKLVQVDALETLCNTL